MTRKSIEEMDRTELIGMVNALQRQIEDLTGPEHTRYYQLGRLAALGQEEEQSGENPARFWQRLVMRRAAE
jgi:hypothetical protein